MLGAIVLTGLGSQDPAKDPAEAWWAGCRAVDWCVQCALISEVKAVVTVGGRGYGFAFVRQPDPDKPLGGVLAAIEMLKAAGCDTTLIVTIDAPGILPSDLQPLLLRRGGARFKGLTLPMLLPFNAVPEDVGPDWSLDRLADEAGLPKAEQHANSRLRLKGGYSEEEKARVIAGMPRERVEPKPPPWRSGA